MHENHTSRDEKRRDARSRSPRRSKHSHRHRHNDSHSHSHSRSHGAARRSASPHAVEASSPPRPRNLPFDARRLGKSDYRAFEPLFAYYLDLQKQKDLAGMEEREARGRWKSFVGKWNRGELAEGWYEPDMLTRCAAAAAAAASPSPAEGDYGEGLAADNGGRRAKDAEEDGESDRGDRSDYEDEDEDDEDEEGGGYGPALPQQQHQRRSIAHRARDATVQDILERDEALRSDRQASRLQDKKLAKERLEEMLPPRAEPGSRERRLEKKKEASERMRQFRERGASPDMEVGDDELMGGGGGGGAAGGGGGGADGLAEHKRAREMEQKRKSQRQVRRDEFERARREEMEERRRAWQAREEGTVSMLRELARQRFG
ncbi:hypothetical protein AAL_04010 [Moelleriella libera RCEF 2490]|uniref:RNA helicase HEL117-like protein n=1 Tax=Moelleriella libera RCEF 2490 TaxID=1081109 RepID=A0A168CMB3_9HYPO|nr:hypothetical protein AAL_04010 [Moelleriella libera RCEF 2490]